jgi:hypothetical protein
MYQVNFYQAGVSGIDPEVFKTKKAAQKEMIAFIDDDKTKYIKAGYKRLGSLKEGLIKLEHPVFGVDCQVKLFKI